MALTASIAAALRQSGRRIVLTGAGGWIGRATIDLLHEALGNAFAERVVCFGSRHDQIRLPDGGTAKVRPLGEIATLPRRPTLLLHFAFLTKDRAEEMPEADYRDANTAIRRTLLGAVDRVGVEAAFLASSGAARYADDAAAPPAMRLYGELKREDEIAFAEWAGRSDTSVTIARIFNLSGPHINKLGAYALSSFMLDALAGRPIAVRAAHEVWRGYVAIRELMSLAFALLAERRPGVTRFETGGEAIELGALAARIAALLNGSVQRPRIGAGQADAYLGDDRAYRLLLGQHGIAPVPLADQIDETVAFLSHLPTRPVYRDGYA